MARTWLYFVYSPSPANPDHRPAPALSFPPPSRPDLSETRRYGARIRVQPDLQCSRERDRPTGPGMRTYI